MQEPAIANEHALVVGAQALHDKTSTQRRISHCCPRAERSSSLSDTQREQSMRTKNRSKKFFKIHEKYFRAAQTQKTKFVSNINNSGVFQLARSILCSDGTGPRSIPTTNHSPVNLVYLKSSSFSCVQATNAMADPVGLVNLKTNVGRGVRGFKLVMVSAVCTAS